MTVTHSVSVLGYQWMLDGLRVPLAKIFVAAAVGVVAVDGRAALLVGVMLDDEPTLTYSF